MPGSAMDGPHPRAHHSQPRRSLVVPASLPSPVCQPEILRQILRYPSDDTLAKCMRVSRLFYEIASSLLYREVSYPSPRFSAIFVGNHVRTEQRTTRRHKPQYNLKNDLIRKIKKLNVSWHEQACSVQYDRCRQLDLETLTFTTQLWCNCRIHCEICGNDNTCYDAAYLCPFINQLRSKRTVLTALREYNAAAVLGKLMVVLTRSEIVTVVISPDSLCCTEVTARELNKCLSASIGLKSLRIIIAPWSGQTATIGDHYHFRSLFLPHRRPIQLDEIQDFCVAVSSPRYKTTVYLVEGIFPTIYPAANLKAAPLPNVNLVEQSVREAMQDKMPAHPFDGPLFPSISFKTRRDYLCEGLTDEIDDVELDRWKTVQQLEDEAIRARKAEREAFKTYRMFWKRWREKMEHHPACLPTALLVLLAEQDGYHQMTELVSRESSIEADLDWCEMELVESLDKHRADMMSDYLEAEAEYMMIADMY